MVTVVSSSKLGSKSISSESSDSSPSATTLGGGVGERILDFLLCFPFRVMIELAQDLTFRGLWLPLREDFDFPHSFVGSSFSDMGEGRFASKDLESAGSDALVGRVGNESVPCRGSLWKRLRRLACAFGVDVGAAGRGGETADTGRLRSGTSPFNLPLVNLSRIMPAVLGRSSSWTVFNEGRAALGGAGALPLTIEERLFVAEWPRRVDRDVSVEEEMDESGRMVSILSENVTRARDGGRAGSSSVLCSRSDGWEIERLNLWPRANGMPSDGVLGALPVGVGVGGLIMDVRS
jgi:hypothetical protein